MIITSESDVNPIDKVVKLVLGKDIKDLNKNDITFGLKFYYDCKRLMDDGKINCFTVTN